MTTAFESMARDLLRTSRHRLPISLTLTSGLWLVTGGICLSSGQANLEFIGWTMLVGAAVFADSFAALWRQQGAMIEDQDLLQRLDEERELGESKAVIILSSIIALAVVGLLGLAIANASEPIGVVIWIAATASAIYASSVIHRRRRRRHQELWDWWDGRQDGTAGGRETR